MRRSHLLGLVALVATTLLLTVTILRGPPTRSIHLLMGQSNMEGRAPLPAVPDPTSEFLEVFRNDYIPGNPQGSTSRFAIEPIDCAAPNQGGNCVNPVAPFTGFNTDTVSADFAGFGPGQAYGMRWLALHPNRPATLVPCAHTSSSMDQWLPTSNHLERATLYGSCVFRGMQAQQLPGRVVCVVFNQGESDAGGLEFGTSWKGKFKTMVGALRADFGPDVAVAYVRMSIQLSNPYTPGLAALRRSQEEAATELPKAGWVDVDDLDFDASRIHFTAASYRILGQRLADKCNELW